MKTSTWAIIGIIALLGIFFIFKLAPQQQTQAMWVGAAGTSLDYCTLDFNDEKTIYPTGLYPTGCVQITNTMVTCSNNCAGKYQGYVSSSYIGRYGYVYMQTKSSWDSMSSADKSSFGCSYTCVHNEPMPVCTTGMKTCETRSDGYYITACVGGQLGTPTKCAGYCWSGTTIIGGSYCSASSSNMCPETSVCQTIYPENLWSVCRSLGGYSISGNCITHGISQCNTAADTTCDGKVDENELKTYANKWINGQVGELELKQAAQAWING